ncbi:MAG TPA: hypothetical protein PK636_00155 [bacterium]|nr:hypothetical protein [bacterium]HPJ71078.1 hypothetical protein [bacterium]HPQ65188.1 hypothetical protein [bacterium]
MKIFQAVPTSKSFHFACLACAIFLLWLPTFYFGFGHEEFRYLHYYSPGEVLKGFRSHWEPSLTESVGYRPGHMLHYWLFYQVAGNSAAANHVIQLLVEEIAAGIFFLLLLNLGGTVSAAFWSVLLYASLGNTAWQVACINNRQHLLLLLSCVGMIYFFSLFLDRARRGFLLASYLFFLGGLMIKEPAVLFPAFCLAAGTMVKKKKILLVIKPLVPTFVIILVYLGVRYFAIREASRVSESPPPIPMNAVWLLREYGRSLAGSLVQAQGSRGYDVMPSDDEFYGWSSCSWFGWAGVALLLSSGFFLVCKENRGKRILAAWAVTVFLLASTLTALWYRTNRFFIASIGLTAFLGLAAAAAFRSTEPGNRATDKVLGWTAIAGLAVYWGANLFAYQATIDLLYPNGIWIVDHCAVELVNSHEYIPEEMEKLMWEKIRLYGDESGTRRARELRHQRIGGAPHEYQY